MSITGMSLNGVPMPTIGPQSPLQPLNFQPQVAPAGTFGANNPLGLHPLALEQPVATAVDTARTAVEKLSKRPNEESRIVRAVKAALRELGLYNGPIDSRKDEQLRVGVLTFQRATPGLRQTGRPDAPTRKALKRALEQKAATSGAAPAQPQTVAAPQGALRAPGMAGMPPVGAPGMMAPGLAGGSMFAPGAGMPGFMGPGLGFGPGMGMPGMAPGVAGQRGPQANVTNQQGLGGVNGLTQHVDNSNGTSAGSRFGVVGGQLGYPGAWPGAGLVGWGAPGMVPGGLGVMPGVTPGMPGWGGAACCSSGASLLGRRPGLLGRLLG